MQILCYFSLYKQCFRKKRDGICICSLRKEWGRPAVRSRADK
ncbi:hypothetical protein CLOSTMETH_00775 [[Clostridium] methylpentosum DSM 5476]|uniref:Uncharacterized protein n=1 Tax=[Clostridium] methylpentosum DSM 5476 TaxID=537013 RepID=C0EAC1_9FIRM|nr:hypothetical protein CLOSTMETH_00775 [[Clostridium] methylpentosum DSM 5476]